MQFFIEYGLFLAKTATIVGAVLVAAGALVALSMRQRKAAEQQHLEVTHLNKQYDEMEQTLSGALLTPRQFKQKLKAQKKADKAKAKAEKQAEKQTKKSKDTEATKNTGQSSGTQVEPKDQRREPNPTGRKAEVYNPGIAEGGASIPEVAGSMGCTHNNVRMHIIQLHKKHGFGYQIDGNNYKILGTPTETWDGQKIEQSEHEKRIFVLDFDGDIRATAVASLRQEISAILTMAGGGDEVVVRLESGGGVVHGYGLAASQLQRLRERKIPLTVAVDKVAASGGYMMACVADKIIAAPFAIIGSIGVLAQLPNLHRLLKKHDVDFEQLYAGEYKRTLTLFGENTGKAREKMQQELEETHGLFKDYVKVQRPGLDVEKVATGEHWLGTRALELGLVDRLQTSDDYLMAARRDAQLILLNYTARKKFLDRLASLASLGGFGFGLQRPQPSEGLERPLLL